MLAARLAPRLQLQLHLLLQLAACFASPPAGTSTPEVGQQQHKQQHKQQQQLEYKCARNCICDRKSGALLAECLGANSSEVLKLDRRTQVLRMASRPNQANHFRLPSLGQLGELRELSLSGLPLGGCDSELFKRGQRLRRLRFRRNRLARLSKRCLQHLDELLELRLERNPLTRLESALFSNLASLRALSLAHNQLQWLAAHQFANLSRLVRLELAGNRLVALDVRVLEPAQASLRRLGLAGNQLAALTVAAGPTFGALARLELDRNQLERLPHLQLAKRFPSLSQLRLSANRLLSLPNRALAGLRLLELDLAHNRLEKLARCAFCNATVERLSLANNANLSLSAASQAPPLEPALLAQAPATSLLLGHSLLGPLHGQLRYLDLSHNGQLAGQLEPLLEPLLNLQYLQLAATGLQGPGQASRLLRNLHELRYLNLSHNAIEAMAAEPLEPLAALQVLDLSHNKLAQLEASFLQRLDELPSLRLLALAGNPWQCSQCQVSHLHDWLLRSPIYNATCLAGRNAAAAIAIASASASATSGHLAPEMSSPGGAPAEPEVAANSQSDVDLPGWLFEQLDALSEFEFDFQVDSEFEFDQRVSAQSTKSPPSSPEVQPTLIGSAESGFEHLSRLLEALNSDKQMSWQPADFCLRCGLPERLAQFELQELSAADFSFCPHQEPRSAPSEPRLGLALAVAIICALLGLMLAVVLLYWRKSRRFVARDERPVGERPPTAGSERRAKARSSASLSSEAELQLADATDYSSAPASLDWQSSDEVVYEDQYDEDLYEEESSESGGLAQPECQTEAGASSLPSSRSSLASHKSVGPVSGATSGQISRPQLEAAGSAPGAPNEHLASADKARQGGGGGIQGPEVRPRAQQ